MDLRFRRRLRPIASVILVFFAWFCIEPWNYALAAQAASKPKTVSSKKPKTASQKFEASLRATQDLVEDLDLEVADKKDITLTLGSLNAHRQIIEAADAEILAEFAATEANLKNKKLSAEILERHRKAVADYKDNAKKLKDALHAINRLEKERKQAKADSDHTGEKAKMDALKNRIKGVKAHLKEKVKTRPHTPLDPNKLPFRSPKPNKRKPRLKKEEFTEFQKPIQLAFNGDPSLLQLAQATPDLPTPQDLAETIEVQFTQEINDLAASLENNPVKIYNWVRNNIEFVPTWGSIQGADHCLLTKECNAMDTTSLLIALLRTSGISARYVMGTIKVPIGQVMNWAGGFTDKASALNFLSSGGIPITGIISGGQVSSAQLEHVWVEAYVDYIPSRGAVHKQGDTWIPLDASFKQYSFSHGIDFQAAVPFDASAFINQVQSSATINETAGYVSNVDGTYIQTTLTNLQSQAENYLTTNLPNATVEDLIGGKNIIVQEFPFFSSTVPYLIIVSGNPVSTLPESLRHGLTFEVTTKAFFGADLTYIASLPELTGRRITLSYVPASTSDQQTVDSYGGLYETPAYLIEVKPQLKVEGIVKAEGAAVGMGNTQSFTMTFSIPNVETDQVQNNITAGGYYAVGLVPDRLPNNYSEVLKQRAEVLSELAQVGDRKSDGALGEQLYLSVMTYFWEVDRQTDVLASQANVSYQKQPGEGVFGLSLSVSELFGVPSLVQVSGTNIDIDRAVYITISKSGDTQNVTNFTGLSGSVASATEHLVIEQMYGVEGISAVKAMQLANLQGLKIYKLNSSNLVSILPTLQVPNAIKTDIQNAVNAGKEVHIPEQELLINQWSGIGYVVVDTVTGAGAYLISGGLSGGASTVNQSLDDVAKAQIEIFCAFFAVIALILALIFIFGALYSMVGAIVGFHPLTLFQFLVAAIALVLLVIIVKSIVDNCFTNNASLIRKRSYFSLAKIIWQKRVNSAI